MVKVGDQICDGPLGQVGTKLLHDDERVRIWEVDLQPGEATAPHRHEHDYILIILEGDRIAAVPHVSANGPSASYIEAEITPGSHVVMKKGGTEAALNVGAKRYYEYLIELKDPQGK
jgi:predicted metal-dependent enzyme (double-stranded beta helix superfamily)